MDGGWWGGGEWWDGVGVEVEGVRGWGRGGGGGRRVEADGGRARGGVREWGVEG